MLIAPAGAGKSHTVAEFARLWTTFTGRRVIGLTTSTNAARVLEHEGLAESYNIAEFLGKTEGSDELRRPIPLHQDDVLVLDEASQLDTADLAMLTEAARQARARIIATGDTAQLGSVEAGGMFRLLAREVPAAQLHEVRRFRAQWERDASVRLRDGDLAAVAAYDRHGRIRGADEQAAYDRAASMWLADHLRGKDVLLLAGSNAEAAELSHRVQAKLTQMGSVGPPQAALSDGNHAGVGNLVRARLNTEIDAGGRQLTNRDTLNITAFRGPDVQVRRQRLDRTWTEPFRVPRTYLARHAELAYAGNVHVAQGRTVDTAHLLVTDTLSRQALYVGMTRGRESNTAHVVTGNTAPPGHQPYQQATLESVLAGVLQRDDGDLSATEQIRQAQDWAGGTGHLLTLWTAAIKQTLHSDIDQQIKARLSKSEAWRYDREASRMALHQRLRTAQLAGHDIAALIEQITAAPMDRARSISSVLHGRLRRLALPDLQHDATWAQRTPATAPPAAHQLAAALDDRARALGERLAISPEPWLARHLGVLAPGASPALRAEYTRRAELRRRLPGSCRDHQPRTSRLPGAASRQPRTRSHAENGPRRPGDPRRSRHPPRPGPRRPRSTSPPRRTRPRRRPARRQQPAPPHSPGRSRRPPASRRRPYSARPHRRGKRHSPRRTASRRTPSARSRQRPVRAMVRRHSRHQGRSRESHSRTATARPRPAKRRTKCAAGSQTTADGRMEAAARGRCRGHELRRCQRAPGRQQHWGPPTATARLGHEPAVRFQVGSADEPRE